MAHEVVRSEKQGDVAVITIDSPPVNSLSKPVVEGLLARIAEANADTAIRAMVVRGGGENFIAGADINELEAAAAGKPLRQIGSLTEALEGVEANQKARRHGH